MYTFVKAEYYVHVILRAIKMFDCF